MFFFFQKSQLYILLRLYHLWFLVLLSSYHYIFILLSLFKILILVYVCVCVCVCVYEVLLC